MPYLGGKAQLGNQIGKILNKELGGTKDFYEPFVGGFNIIPHIYTSGSMHASDAHRALISMYKALQEGWLPPNEVSETEYSLAQWLPDSDPNKAFIGFACSFGGRYFGGYARGGSSNYVMNGISSLSKKLFHIKKTQFRCLSFFNLSIPPGSVVYCDPPYVGTTDYTSTFSSRAFWQWVERTSRDSVVFVSEYSCPVDCEVVMESRQQDRICKDKERNNIKVERVFRCEK